MSSIGEILGRPINYINRRRYLRKAKKIGEVQPTIISKDEYLEIKEEKISDSVDIVVDKGEDDEYEVVEMVISPKKIICPDCGGITYEGLDFCHKCGGEMADFMQ